MGEGSEQHVLMTHKSVHPYPDGKTFCVEAFCSFAECYIFNMADGQPRLLVGRTWQMDTLVF